MKIYIASSWKNQHAVEMFSRLLRERGHEVVSFVEENFGEIAKIGLDSCRTYNILMAEGRKVALAVILPGQPE